MGVRRKTLCLIFVILLLGMAGNALAEDKDWTNDGDNRLWSNSANWSPGVPGEADKAAIRAGAIPGPIIDSGTSAVAENVVLGDWSSDGDTLDITGGSLATGGWFIMSYNTVNNATLNVSGGTVSVGSHLDVGRAGVGHMHMAGGTVTVNGAFGLGTSGGSGDVFLDGGTIRAASFTMTSGSSLDITGGTLIVDGDCTATIATYAGDGWITAYNGSGTLNIDYGNSNPLKTTVTATIPTEPPAKAANPYAPDGATNVSTVPTLSWSPGTDAKSHDVYFGTTSPGTFQGNQTATTFDPGTLNQDTVYYWRIDEKNALGTTTGDVWSFRTYAGGSDYSLVGKVMAGYQGWFNAPGDGTSKGWTHWGSNGTFSPTECTVDFWPDMSEYTAGEKFLASEFYDGIDHYVFSSHNQTTVNRHFKWMKDYGIDGAYLQRFAVGLTPGSSHLAHKNDVLDYVKNAANLHGRKYAVMYDLSGLASEGDVQIVVDDWKFLVDNGKIPQTQAHDPAYMFHQGKPVVAVWGLAKNRAYEGQATLDLIDFLKNDPTYGGYTVMIGVDKDWRISTDPYFQQTRDIADIISPWVVGAYTNTSGVNNWAANKGKPDKDWCDANGKEFLPVMFPGFSWYNMGKGPFNQIPREGGQFLWDQVKADISTVGATMLYVAMFDEVDEGTAIFKLSNDPPNVPPAQFVTLDIDGYDVPSDEYLWLAGQAGRALRGEIPVNQTRPIRNPASSKGTITLDASKYPCSTAAEIQVIDTDLNTDNNSVETVTVTIVSDSETTGEPVQLTETGVETADFHGTIALETTDSAGVLRVGEGDTVTATYIDADDGQGGNNVTVTDTASVDCTPPTISNVETINILPFSATVTFDTDEPASGMLHYGLTCAILTETTSGSGLQTAHTINLTGLQENTAFFYEVEAVDEAGNSAADDNGGACYFICDRDGTCEPGEDCNNCPTDCISGGGSATCGNGICEPSSGEDCLSCPGDCGGKQVGATKRQFCCGDGDGVNPVDCSDPRCLEEPYACTDTPVDPYCCGDGSCEGAEDSYNCGVDCGAPPYCGDSNCDPGEDQCSCPGDCGFSSEPEAGHCADGIDNDCDGFADCDDSDCSGESDCTCRPKGVGCVLDSECCSNWCHRGNCK